MAQLTPAPPYLLRDLHVDYIARLARDDGTLTYHLTTHLRLNAIYWAVTALELLRSPDTLGADDVVKFVLDCWDDGQGGFGSFPRHDAHVLATLSAVQILAIKGRLSELDRGRRRERLVQYVLSLQDEATGAFYGDDTRLETDSRFLYCAVQVLALLGSSSEAPPASYPSSSTPCHASPTPLSRLPRARTVRQVLACRNFDGGFGTNPGSESHAGQAFVCVGALAILDALDALDATDAEAWLEREERREGVAAGPARQEGATRPPLSALSAWSADTSSAWESVAVRERAQESDSLDSSRSARPPLGSMGGRDKLAMWLAERQLPGGGLNGRPQKLEDVCYSWWVLSSLAMLGRLHWINRDKLVGFILSAQDPDSGGISDRPGNVADVFHTLFGVAGLSLLGYGRDAERKGAASAGEGELDASGLPPASFSPLSSSLGPLAEVDPVYCLPASVTGRMGLLRRGATEEPSG